MFFVVFSSSVMTNAIDDVFSSALTRNKNPDAPLMLAAVSDDYSRYFFHHDHQNPTPRTVVADGKLLMPSPLLYDISVLKAPIHNCAYIPQQLTFVSKTFLEK